MTYMTCIIKKYEILHDMNSMYVCTPLPCYIKSNLLFFQHIKFVRLKYYVNYITCITLLVMIQQVI